MNYLLDVTVSEGKYQVVQYADGRIEAFCYRETWRDCTGDGLILSLAQEVAELRRRLKDKT